MRNINHSETIKDMKRKTKKRGNMIDRASYRSPSKVGLEAHQQTGAGAHDKRPTRSEDERLAIQEELDLIRERRAWAEEHLDALEMDSIYEEMFKDLSEED